MRCNDKMVKKNNYTNPWFMALFSWKGLITALIMSAALGYLTWSFDLIPDSVAVFGFLDDVAIFALAFIGIWKITNILSKRFSGKKSNRTYGQRLFAALISGKGMIVIVLTGLTMSYFVGTFDLIPDTTPVIGYLDDIGIMLGALASFLTLTKIFSKNKKK